MKRFCHDRYMRTPTGNAEGSNTTKGRRNEESHTLTPPQNQGGMLLQGMADDTTDKQITNEYLGEGDGTPLQYSCLENPTDGGAWWAAVHGVSKSRTQLSNFTFTFHFMHWRRKWQPTPVCLPGESQGRESLVGCGLWVHTESDTTEAT